MRPVNLIPPEERRGERAPPAPAAPLRVLGALALALAAITAVAMTGNQIDEREAERDRLEAGRGRAHGQAAGLRALRGLRVAGAGARRRPSPASPRAASTGSGSCASSRW